MNDDRTLDSPAAGDDWLDRLLADDASEHRDLYVADDGFTARVMAALPAPVTAPAWRKPVVVALWGVATPSFQSLMSHRVDATEQGQLQGALGSIRALTGMIGPLLFTQVFAAAVGLERVQLLGAPFLLSAALLAAALAIGWRVLPRAQAPGP